jgi:NAD(P)-dependent dehydrogenase (short-subunit alcohol dehydrogenase family)
MADLFKGKKVFITGGATGMGLGFSRSFLEHGANVFIASRNAERLELASEKLKELTGKSILWKVMDVREESSVEEAVGFIEQEWGSIDVVVNNAAGNFFCPIENLSENGWRTVVDIVLDGTFRVSKKCFPLLKQNGGSIVNIIANYAWNAAPYVGHSGAAKAGVLNLTRTLALEWGRYNIRVNAMCPGVVLTEGVKENLLGDESMIERLENDIPVGGIASVEQMAQQVLYLCSPAADVITGEVLVADGGQSLVGNMFYSLGREFYK